MIWYIIIVIVYSFQNGYIKCTESILSMEDGTRVSSAPYMASVYIPGHSIVKPKFVSIGVIVHDSYVLSMVSNLGILQTIKLTVYFGTIHRGLGDNLSTNVTTIIRDQNRELLAIDKCIVLLKLEQSISELRGDLHNVHDAILALPDQGIPADAAGLNITIVGYQSNKSRKYRLSRVNMEVSDVSTNLFYAKNFNTHVSTILDNRDRGCPAFFNGTFIGTVASINDTTVTFTNIIKWNDFIIRRLNSTTTMKNVQLL